LEILARLKNQFTFRISAYARIESRLGIDKKIKKDIDEIVSSLENGKYHPIYIYGHFKPAGGVEIYSDVTTAKAIEAQKSLRL
jgi:hypothetical protein